MKAKLDKSKASYKLDLIETANADPMVTAADLKLLAAYASVMEWPSCKAWLSVTLARAKTGLSERQYWTSRARLSGKSRNKNKPCRQYLIHAHGAESVTEFKLINPWRDEAIDHVAAMTAHFQAAERHRKATRRAKKTAQEAAELSLYSMQGHEPSCPCTQCSPVPALSAGKYPSDSTPMKKGSREEEPLGSNVVLFNGERKAS